MDNTSEQTQKSMPIWLKSLLVIILIAAVGIGIYFLVQLLLPKSGPQPTLTPYNMPATIKPLQNMMQTNMMQTNMMPTNMMPTTTIKTTNIYYKLEDPVGIANERYSNIPFKTFGLNNNLNNWTINILFTTTTTTSKWQGIIGNIYNNEVSGENIWGFWISPNPTKYIHFRIGAWNENFPSLGVINNKTLYKLIINFNNGIYRLTLINMADNVSNTVEIRDKPKLNSTTGSICIGGHWQSGRKDEVFDGTIDYVDFSLIPTNSFSYPVSANGVWDSSAPNEFNCPGAPGSRLDTPSYCIFDNENDAINRCNLDPACAGYVSTPTARGFQLTKNPVSNAVANGKFYKKTVT